MRTTWISLVALLGACATHAPAPAITPLTTADDSLDVEMNMPATIGVLDNDSGVDDGALVVLVTNPGHGTATLGNDNGMLIYTPAMEYLGDDGVDYSVTNPDGKVATSHVAITVGCATCAIGSTMTLSWSSDANLATDMLIGYRTYLGATEDTSTMTKIDDILMTRPNFDPSAPTVTYDAWTDLHLVVGDQACFAVTAYNAAGESDFSPVVCTIVTAHTAMRVGVSS